MKAGQTSMAMAEFRPGPNTLYTLETAAHITRTSRRSILIYCRSGLVQPVVEPVLGRFCFDEEAIQAIRRIEFLRSAHGINLTGLRLIFDLLHEVEQLREEVRFLRGS